MAKKSKKTKKPSRERRAIDRAVDRQVEGPIHRGNKMDVKRQRSGK